MILSIFIIVLFILVGIIFGAIAEMRKNIDKLEDEVRILELMNLKRTVSLDKVRSAMKDKEARGENDGEDSVSLGETE